MIPIDPSPSKPDASPFEYTDSEWAAVEAAFPSPLAVGADSEAARTETEASATIYCVIRDSYKFRSKDRMKVAKAAQRKIKMRAKLAQNDETDLRHQLAPGQALIMGYKMQALSHQGRAAFERDQFYDSVLSTWRLLGGKLKTSRPTPNGFKQLPGGPLLRFLDAILRPVMNEDIPGAEGLVAIVKSHAKGTPRKGKTIPEETISKTK